MLNTNYMYVVSVAYLDTVYFAMVIAFNCLIALFGLYIFLPNGC